MLGIFNIFVRRDQALAEHEAFKHYRLFSNDIFGVKPEHNFGHAICFPWCKLSLRNNRVSAGLTKDSVGFIIHQRADHFICQSGHQIFVGYSIGNRDICCPIFQRHGVRSVRSLYAGSDAWKVDALPFIADFGMLRHFSTALVQRFKCDKSIFRQFTGIDLIRSQDKHHLCLSICLLRHKGGRCRNVVCV